MKQLKLVRKYVKSVQSHRAEVKREANVKKRYYNKSIRGCIMARTIFHDLDKVFTLDLLRLAKLNDDLIYDPMLKESCYIRPFSHHDTFMYTIQAVEMVKNMELFKHISLFNRRKYYILTFEELDEIVNNIKTLAKHFGENPAAFYLRNYHCFNFDLSSFERQYIEGGLEIDFSDFFEIESEIGTMKTVYDAFDKSNPYFNDSYAYHVFVTCLVNYGVNILDALCIKDTYKLINDEVTMMRR